jgi:hypothetical protein
MMHGLRKLIKTHVDAAATSVAPRSVDLHTLSLKHSGLGANGIICLFGTHSMPLHVLSGTPVDVRFQ